MNQNDTKTETSRNKRFRDEEVPGQKLPEEKDPKRNREQPVSMVGTSGGVALQTDRSEKTCNDQDSERLAVTPTTHNQPAQSSFDEATTDGVTELASGLVDSLNSNAPSSATKNHHQSALLELDNDLSLESTDTSVLGKTTPSSNETVKDSTETPEPEISTSSTATVQAEKLKKQETAVKPSNQESGTSATKSHSLVTPAQRRQSIEAVISQQAPEASQTTPNVTASRTQQQSSSDSNVSQIDTQLPWNEYLNTFKQRMEQRPAQTASKEDSTFWTEVLPSLSQHLKATARSSSQPDLVSSCRYQNEPNGNSFAQLYPQPTTINAPEGEPKFPEADASLLIPDLDL